MSSLGVLVASAVVAVSAIALQPEPPVMPVAGGAAAARGARAAAPPTLDAAGACDRRAPGTPRSGCAVAQPALARCDSAPAAVATRCRAFARPASFAPADGGETRS